ncbi:LOW QUALITY PROTEIN: hypothetical protein CVT25_015431 [Psilocybe cyanescens]|uniref:Uncharacterized protein n=1 Tax=Psilocybe cyanescens TaxID=93625 RepID=A0A409WHF4_PSICY|nr:LOW QUALITY PROTEIN: hypothetical protein CVT25_015431 [Psilocybe cyanescens]
MPRLMLRLPTMFITECKVSKKDDVDITTTIIFELSRFIHKGLTVFGNLQCGFSPLFGIRKDPGQVSFLLGINAHISTPFPIDIFPDLEIFRPERFLDTINPRLKQFDFPSGFDKLVQEYTWLSIRCSSMSREFFGHFRFNRQLMRMDRKCFQMSTTIPVSFECQMVPRNDKVKACIEAEWETATVLLAHWES